MSSNDTDVCSKCNRTVRISSGNSIICDGECKRAFHKGCSGLNVKKFSEIIANKEIWFCVNCKGKQIRRRSNLIPPLDAPSKNKKSASNLDVSRSLNNSRISTGIPKNCSNEDLWNKLDDIYSSLNAEISNLKQTVNNYQGVIDKLSDENVDLRNENIILHNQLQQNEDRLGIVRQEMIDHNLVISGLNETEDENLEELIHTLTKTLKVETNTNYLKEVYRQPTENSRSSLPAPVVVEFHHKATRDHILELRKSRERIHLDSKMINPEIEDGDNHTIFISEHLTSLNSYLFKLARDLKREGKIKYAWFSDGKLLIRRAEKSRVIKILSVRDFNKIRENEASSV